MPHLVLQVSVYDLASCTAPETTQCFNDDFSVSSSVATGASKALLRAVALPGVGYQPSVLTRGVVCARNVTTHG